MTETDQMLRTVLLTQAEILGRLSRIESALADSQTFDDRMQSHLMGTGRPRHDIDPRHDCLAELQSLLDSDSGQGLLTEIEDLVDKVRGRI
ncbi:hypothetical protein FZZ93_01200 [Halomonas eurihalina]|uniref:Uncharacterized protein n=1 Tax=Halomonas eurihalina TaxID=42566 RepID=A0A5D9DDX2_HALER|nr:hypothetical protein [Halomonas eurihalina]MDR5858189.1 hypothetical protein [Halomonas eurihalina]TZG41310.1 hypothetical protein FZZ93_01200 [Halomonas eurihalina]